MDDTNQTGFALRLRQLRKQKNLSQSELARMAQLHYNHLGRYERGSSQPSAPTLKRLADALGVSTDYLIEGEVKDAAKADFQDRELLHIFEEVEKLDEQDKHTVKQFLGAFLMKKQFLALAAK